MKRFRTYGQSIRTERRTKRRVRSIEEKECRMEALRTKEAAVQVNARI